MQLPHLIFDPTAGVIDGVRGIERVHSKYPGLPPLPPYEKGYVIYVPGTGGTASSSSSGGNGPSAKKSRVSMSSSYAASDDGASASVAESTDEPVLKLSVSRKHGVATSTPAAKTAKGAAASRGRPRKSVGIADVSDNGVYMEGSPSERGESPVAAPTAAIKAGGKASAKKAAPVEKKSTSLSLTLTIPKRKLSRSNDSTGSGMDSLYYDEGSNSGRSLPDSRSDVGYAYDRGEEEEGEILEDEDSPRARPHLKFR
jgi:hypothetical protein